MEISSSTPAKFKGDTILDTVAVSPVKQSILSEDANVDEEFYDSFEVKTEYEKEEFELVKVPGNGYCMVNSVIAALEAGDKINKNDVIRKVEKKLLENIDHYSNFINTSEIDFINELKMYARHGNYNATIADLLMKIMSDVLEVTIVLLRKENNKYVMHNPSFDMFKYGSGGLVPVVYVLKAPEHYDALILKKGKDNPDEHEMMFNESFVENEKKKIVDQRKSTRNCRKKGANQEELVQKEKQKKPNDAKKKNSGKNVQNDKEGWIKCDTCDKWHKILEIDYVCERCVEKEKENDSITDSTKPDKIQIEKKKKMEEQEIKRKDEKIKGLENKLAKVEGEFEQLKVKLCKKSLEQQKKEKSEGEEKERMKREQEILKDRTQMAEKDTQQMKKRLEEFQLKYFQNAAENIGNSSEAAIEKEGEEKEKENEKNEDSEGDQDKHSKENKKLKREVKKLHKELSEAKEELNKVKDEVYQKERCIRNLNDALDQLKVSCCEDEVSRTQKSRSKSNINDKENKGGRNVMKMNQKNKENVMRRLLPIPCPRVGLCDRTTCEYQHVDSPKKPKQHQGDNAANQVKNSENSGDECTSRNIGQQIKSGGQENNRTPVHEEEVHSITECDLPKCSHTSVLEENDSTDGNLTEEGEENDQKAPTEEMNDEQTVDDIDDSELHFHAEKEYKLLKSNIRTRDKTICKYFQLGNCWFSKNGTCKFLHPTKKRVRIMEPRDDKNEDEHEMKKENNGKKAGISSDKKMRECYFYRKGKCKSGDGCKFAHTTQLSKDVKMGDNIKRKDDDEKIKRNDRGTNKVNEKHKDGSVKECWHHKWGKCTFGSQCKFFHMETDVKHGEDMKKNLKNLSKKNEVNEIEKILETVAEQKKQIAEQKKEMNKQMDFLDQNIKKIRRYLQ